MYWSVLEDDDKQINSRKEDRMHACQSNSAKLLFEIDSNQGVVMGSMYI